MMQYLALHLACQSFTPTTENLFFKNQFLGYMRLLEFYAQLKILLHDGFDQLFGARVLVFFSLDYFVKCVKCFSWLP